MKLYRKFACLLILFCFTTALAQDATCSAIVQQALADVQQDCAPTGRNQACYGYVSLAATPREGVQNFTFAKAGDLASVGDINTLRLSALDTAKDTWGIALMKLQANLPDTLPGQNVTFLLFGDVEITNAVAPGTVVPATVQLSANSNANIRTAPSTNGQIAGSVSKGEAITANGRNADSTWLRIQIPDSDSLGWVFANLVTPASDVSALSVVDSTNAEIPFKPMQAFYFKTGITQTSCAEAPQDGILIQTPKGAGQINIRANDVDIQLGSTAYLQAQPDDNMTVSVVEGEGHVTANGTTVAVPAGTQVTIPVDADLKPTGDPSPAQPYDESLVAPLPVQVLPEAITIAPPATAEPDASSGGMDFSNLSIPGVDTSGLDGMDVATFCKYMNDAFAQEGVSSAMMLQQMQMVRGFVPADQRAEFDQFIALLKAC
ncbi:MAG: SH3 domain-containing protein [Chloroflexi bacterium]|nr:SH3 domain-containing protein [Chloroflexota bacterium]